jgi:biopolymer transport protein ExbB
MFDIFRKAGPVMIPLALCSITAVAICLERLLFFLWISTNTSRLRQTLKWTINHRGISEAAAIAKRTRGPVAAVLYAGLSTNSFGREDIEAAMQIAAQREIANLEKRLRTLDVIVTISPLLGLLGTVTGIIRSFNVLAQSQGLAGPAALSAGIAEALLTTAIGLIIAIPTLVMYQFFNSLVDRFVLDMNESATQLLDILEHRRELREVSATQ